MDISELEEKAHKGTFEDVLSRFFLRKISIRVTKYLVQTSITPNQITVMSFLIGVLASFCFAVGQYPYLLASAILVPLSVIFDLVDGEVARVKSLQSLLGAWLDPVLDMVRAGMFFFGIAFGVQTPTNFVLVWVVSYLAFFGLIVGNYSSTKQLEVYGKGEVSRVKESSTGVVQKLYGNIYGIGSITLLMSVGAALNQVLVSSMIIAFTSNLDWISKLVWYYTRQKKDKDYAQQANSAGLS